MPNRFLAALAGLTALFASPPPLRPIGNMAMRASRGIAWLQMRPDTPRQVAALLRQGGCWRRRSARWRHWSRRASGPTASSRSATASLCLQLALPERRRVQAVRPQGGVQGRQLRVGADRAQRAAAGRPERAGARATDGAGLPHPFRRRPAPADARRRPCRPWRQQGRGELRSDRRAHQSAQHLGRLAGRARNLHAAGWPCGAARRRSRRPSGSGSPAEASRTGAGRCGARRATSPTRPCCPIHAVRRRSNARRSTRREVQRADPGGARECRRKAVSAWPGCSTMRWARSARRLDRGGPSHRPIPRISRRIGAF